MTREPTALPEPIILTFNIHFPPVFSKIDKVYFSKTYYHKNLVKYPILQLLRRFQQFLIISPVALVYLFKILRIVIYGLKKSAQKSLWKLKET